jgi:hypothetical protein
MKSGFLPSFAMKPPQTTLASRSRQRGWTGAELERDGWLLRTDDSTRDRSGPGGLGLCLSFPEAEVRGCSSGHVQMMWQGPGPVVWVLCCVNFLSPRGEDVMSCHVHIRYCGKAVLRSCLSGGGGDGRIVDVHVLVLCWSHWLGGDSMPWMEE